MNPSLCRKIYIASDALWDLRQGTLAKIDTSFAVSVTASPSYYTRDDDLFTVGKDTLDKSVYDKVYERFQHEILRMSLRTEILDFIADLCRQYIKQIIVSPFINDFEIEINTNPFDLSEDEAVVLLECLRKVFTPAIRISIKNIPLSQLTMAKINEEYAAMVLYNYHTWLNLHTEELKKTSIQGVGLFVPRMYFADKTKITDDLRKELKQKGKDEFDMLAEILKPFVNLQYLPIAFYCASTPINLPEYRQLIKTA